MSAPFVHPTAVVDAGVELGPGVKVWHFAHVSEGARIGEGTSLGQGSFVGRGVHVGARVKVQNHVSIYEGVSVEDDVFLGPSCVFTNVSCPRAFDARMDELAPTRIGRGATIGANATIVCGHDVGEFAFVGAGAVVTRDVPPYALVVGNPARQIGWVSRLGRRLPEGTEVACPESGERYRVDGASCVAIAASPEDPGGPASARVLVRAPTPFVDLRALHAPIESELKRAFDRVLRSGAFVLGAEVAAFEQEAAQFLGVEHAVGVSSGSDALLVSLMALGVGPGDEVVTTPFSFFATVGAILRLGARPVFVDIDPETLLIDPARVEQALTPRTRAILPVHLFGRACDVPAMRAASRRRGFQVPIVEDAAQAFGAKLGDVSVGALGDVGCFSFFPTKTLGALGDGGLVTTNDATLAAAIRRLRVHGAGPRYHHATLGGNFRLDALQAAFLRVKLPHLPGWLAARRAVAKVWAEELGRAGVLGEGGWGLVRADGEGHGAAQLALLLPEGARDRVRDALAREGVGTEVYYPEPLHLQPALGDHRGPGEFPRAEEACRRVLCLPLGVGVTRERVVGVVARGAMRWVG